MVEIYWLQVLGNIGFCFKVGFWLCVVITLCVVIWCITDYDEIIRDKRLIQRFKKFAMVFAFFTAGSIIIPMQRDLMMIYGLGGSIDYIKSNDKAKELPDKVVNALTKYIDYIEKEKSEKK